MTGDLPRIRCAIRGCNAQVTRRSRCGALFFCADHANQIEAAICLGLEPMSVLTMDAIVEEVAAAFGLDAPLISAPGVGVTRAVTRARYAAITIARHIRLPNEEIALGLGRRSPNNLPTFVEQFDQWKAEDPVLQEMFREALKRTLDRSIRERRALEAEL